MAETIISKKCTKCKEIKPLSEFCRDRANKIGRKSCCKICDLKQVKKYQQTKRGKVVKRKANARYKKTEKGKAAEKRYSQSEKGKAIRKRYRRTEKYKAIHNACIERYIHRNQNKHKANITLNNAIKLGKLPRPDTLRCSCKKQAEQYHHHKGYAPENWLNVVPVCTKCHNIIHQEKRRQSI